MKRAIIISVLLFCGSADAHADHFEMMYRDLIRPGGQPRSDAVYQENLDFCYGQTGADRNLADTPAFKQCMLGRGYRWQYTHDVSDQPAPSRHKKPAKTWIDPDTGLTCHHGTFMGVAATNCSNH
jgi:hypothetical protein